MSKEIVIKQKQGVYSDIKIESGREALAILQTKIISKEKLDVIIVEKSSIPALLSALTELSKEK